MRYPRIRAAVVVVVVVLAFSAPAFSQSVSGLLQKGIYTEETVGDLDAAIKIYEQVVAEAEANRSHVAQAHYRLAMCYEKKGRKQEAATSLQKLVEQFPKETEVVAQARAKLSALGQASSGVVMRLVWPDAVNFPAAGAVSPDGKYLAFTDWETGDLAVRDLATGKNRRLTNKGPWSKSGELADRPKFSPDGSQLAYAWFDNKNSLSDLRVVNVAGGEPRVLYSEKDKYQVACGWAPDGKSILTEIYLADRQQIALIGVTVSSVRIVKSRDDRRKAKVGPIGLAPDGRTIAYSRLAEPGSATPDIFLIDVETGQETQVTTHAADKSIVAWTPNGHLLYEMEREGAKDAWLIRIAGGKPQGEAELVKRDLGAIVPLGFTRDGTFYYHSSSRGPSLFTATLDWETGTATATPLAGEKFNLLDALYLGDWSPDGEYLAYWATRSRETQEMRIVSTKTGQIRVLKPDLRGMNRFRWSPDGRSFIANAHGPNRHIYQIDAMSGQVSTAVESGKGGDNGPVWSHDGRGIFFGKRPSDAAGAFRIVHRDLQTQTERDVLPSGNPIFDGTLLSVRFDPSPDGRQLALVGKPNDESMVLWLIPVDGGAPRELLKLNTPGTTAGDVGWTPDGRFVLFTQLGRDEAQRGLWYVSASGGEPRKLALSGMEAKNITRIAIHSDGKQLALNVSGTGKSEVWALENFLPPVKAAP